MATTEIEKLERRYAENPQGLTFAPLAEVHRKNGDISRALELLRAGLELHPNYIPASIVLGRCHWDTGDLPAAEAAFSHVLRLDDENVIALKSLADINERLGRLGEAQRWLNRLISIDRSNEEARQQLSRIEGARQQPGAPPVVEVAPTPASAKQKPESEPVDLTTAIAEPAASTASEQSAETEESKSPALEFIDTSEPSRASVEAPLILENRQPPASPESAPVAGLISQEFVPPPDHSYRSHPELTHDFVSAADPPDRLEVETAENVELRSSGAAEFRVPNAAEDFLELASSAATPTNATPVSLPEPTPAPPPPEPVQVRPSVSSSAEAKDHHSYSVRHTKGQSVASFFQALLAARPVGGRDGAAQLREAGAAGSGGTPTGPSAGADTSVSFDDFFGAPAGGSAPSKGSTETGKDDLDQFQSWLQNLKR
jgi:hypothetical protein